MSSVSKENYILAFSLRLCAVRYELTVSMPKVIIREDENGRSEPYEDEHDLDAYSGTIIQELNQRGGELRDMRNDGQTIRIEFHMPARA